MSAEGKELIACSTKGEQGPEGLRFLVQGPAILRGIIPPANQNAYRCISIPYPRCIRMDMDHLYLSEYIYE